MARRHCAVRGNALLLVLLVTGSLTLFSYFYWRTLQLGLEAAIVRYHHARARYSALSLGWLGVGIVKQQAGQLAVAEEKTIQLFSGSWHAGEGVIWAQRVDPTHFLVKATYYESGGARMTHIAVETKEKKLIILGIKTVTAAIQ